MSFIRDGQEVTPFDYTIKELFIIGENAEVDVTYLFGELNINENMFAKCITGSLTLLDSLNIVSNLPIVEGDLIKGFFTRNENDPYVEDFDPDFELEFLFEVVKITRQEKIKQDTQIWTLAFVSSTWTDHLSSRISKSYRQWHYSDMVIDIYDGWLSRGGLRGELPVKPLDFTATEKLWNIIIPNLKPYDAITFLTRRSWLGDFVNYLFWEDKESFYFKPLAEILEKPPVADYYTATADQYTTDAKIPDTKILETQYLNVLSMKYLGYHDISLAAMSGMISNRLIKHDIFFKRVVDYFPRGSEAGNYTLDTPYDYIGDFAKLPHTDNSIELIRPKTNLKFAWDDGNGLLSVSPDHFWQWDDQETFEVEKWVRQRKGQIAQLKFVKFEISTPGNFTRRVGDKIHINMWSPEWKAKSPFPEDPKEDLRFSGNYLITALRRKFTHDNCTCIMEIIRDDYVDLTTDAIWENAKEDSGLRYNGKGEVIGL